MDQYLSFWNLMAYVSSSCVLPFRTASANRSARRRYDYAGSWDSVANHQANLFGTSPDSLSTDRAIRFYTSQGVPVQKLVLGTSPSLSLFCSCSLTGRMQVFRCTGDHSQTVKDLVNHSKESVLDPGKQVSVSIPSLRPYSFPR